MDQNINPGTQMPEANKSVGTTVGIIVIVLVLIFGAVYFFKQASLKNAAPTNNTPEMSASVVDASPSNQGTSTNIADIEKDLNATDFSGLDNGLNDITL